MHYQIVYFTDTQGDKPIHSFRCLENKVNTFLAKGYKPVGGVIVTEIFDEITGITYYHTAQAIYNKDKSVVKTNGKTYYNDHSNERNGKGRGGRGQGSEQRRAERTYTPAEGGKGLSDID